MFAPRPDVAIAEMLRVLAAGRDSRVLHLAARNVRRPHVRARRQLCASPTARCLAAAAMGRSEHRPRRLGNRVKDLRFERATMTIPVLSLSISAYSRRIGPMRKLVEMLSAGDPARLDAAVREYEAIIGDYVSRQRHESALLMTRARRRSECIVTCALNFQEALVQRLLSGIAVDCL